MTLHDIRSHYVDAARRALAADAPGLSGAESVTRLFQAPYRYWETWLRAKIDRQGGLRVLDYGCGQGAHSVYAATLGAKVVGVDVVTEGLTVASLRAVAAGLAGRIHFVVADCERLSLADATFDVVFSSGMLFCLDPHRAFGEMARALRPAGTAFVVETLGENPLLGAWRRIRAAVRPSAASSFPHRFRLSELSHARDFFGRVEIRYFGLAAAAAALMHGARDSQRVAAIADRIDTLLCRVPGLRRWSMKVVIILSEPLNGFRPGEADQSLVQRR